MGRMQQNVEALGLLTGGSGDEWYFDVSSDDYGSETFGPHETEVEAVMGEARAALKGEK